MTYLPRGPVRATCPVCHRDDILVNKGGVLPTLRKHKPSVFRARSEDGYRVTEGWCAGSGRPV